MGCAFMDRHVDIKQAFEYEVMHHMSEIMAHTITLHLLDAPRPGAPFLAKTPGAFRSRAEEGTRFVPQSFSGDIEPLAA